MFGKWLATVLFAFTVSAAAQMPLGIAQLGTPLPTDTPGKVEVVEFFWYGCPHCYALEPVIESWVKKAPQDVQFKRVPAVFNQQWEIAGRAYYALEALGELNRLHKPLFDAIHRDGLRITDERALTAWLNKNGVDVGKFSAATKSFAVESKLKRAKQLLELAKLDGVPALVVNGRYVITTEIGSHEKMLAAVDQLVMRARKEIATAAPEKK